MSTYTHGHAEPVLRSHAWRTVANSAGYLAPELTPGRRVLDVGCGPGTITVDLARHVAPGTVVGLDPAPAAIDAAREWLTLAVAPISVELVCADLDTYTDSDGFDVVHAHQVLQHLDDPVAALGRMSQLCRPGGVVAARDADYSAFTWFPQVPELDEWLHLYRTLARSCGGEPDAGRRLLSWAQQAGLQSVRPSASVWCFATPQDRAWWGGMWADRIVDSDLARNAVAAGLAQPADLQRLRRGWRQWAAAPDGWFLVPHGEILARPGEST
jgi:SAM-dependent methyltransferase